MKIISCILFGFLFTALLALSAPLQALEEKSALTKAKEHAGNNEWVAFDTLIAEISEGNPEWALDFFKEALRCLPHSFNAFSEPRRSQENIYRAMAKTQKPEALGLIIPPLITLADEEDSNYVFLIEECVLLTENPQTRKELADYIPSLLKCGKGRFLAPMVLGFSGISAKNADSLVEGWLKQKNDELTRYFTILCAGQLQLEKRLTDIRKAAKDKSEHIRSAAAQALGFFIGNKDARKELLALTEDKAWAVREAAAAALRGHCFKDPMTLLNLALAEESLRVRNAYVDSLRAITGEDFGPNFAKWKEWIENNWKEKPEPKKPDDLKTEQRGDQSGMFYYGQNVRSNRVCFLLDTSGSMNETGKESKKSRLSLAREEMKKTFEQFHEQIFFNVVLYNSSVDSWQSGNRLVSATKENIEKVLTWIPETAPEAGTDIFEAIEWTLKNGEADEVFFLTDGSPSTGKYTKLNDVLYEITIRNHLRRLRINCVCLEQSPEIHEKFPKLPDAATAARFLQRLAELNGGQYSRMK